MTLHHQVKFIISDEEIKNSPSRRDGIAEGLEEQLRFYGTEVICEACALLKLNQVVVATGQTLFHRFYALESMRKFDVKEIAKACVWLGTKLEEEPRRPRDILMVFQRIFQRREGRKLQPLNLHGREGGKSELDVLKARLEKMESILLQAFGFTLHLEHPHKFLFSFMHFLATNREFKQEACNLCNDSLRTTLCLRFPPLVLACGIIFLASRRLKVPLPQDPAWWEVYRCDDIRPMYEIARTVQALYSRPKAEYVSVTDNAWQQSELEASPLPVASPCPGPHQNGHAPDDKGPSEELRPEQVVSLEEISETLKPQVGPAEHSKGAVPKDRAKPRERERSPARAKDYDRYYDRDRSAYREREKYGERHRSRSRDRDKDRSRNRDRHRDRDRERGRDARDRERDRRYIRNGDYKDQDRERSRRREGEYHGDERGWRERGSDAYRASSRYVEDERRLSRGANESRQSRPATLSRPPGLPRRPGRKSPPSEARTSGSTGDGSDPSLRKRKAPDGDSVSPAVPKASAEQAFSRDVSREEASAAGRSASKSSPGTTPSRDAEKRHSKLASSNGARRDDDAQKATSGLPSKERDDDSQGGKHKRYHEPIVWHKN
eukprot:jgi/Botrbrau1/268/Bobra.0022s0237.1